MRPAKQQNGDVMAIILGIDPGSRVTGFVIRQVRW